MAQTTRSRSAKAAATSRQSTEDPTSDITGEPLTQGRMGPAAKKQQTSKGRGAPAVHASIEEEDERSSERSASPPSDGDEPEPRRREAVERREPEPPRANSKEETKQQMLERMHAELRERDLDRDIAEAQRLLANPEGSLRQSRAEGGPSRKRERSDEGKRKIVKAPEPFDCKDADILDHWIAVCELNFRLLGSEYESPRVQCDYGQMYIGTSLFDDWERRAKSRGREHRTWQNLQAFLIETLQPEVTRRQDATLKWTSYRQRVGQEVRQVDTAMAALESRFPRPPRELLRDVFFGALLPEIQNLLVLVTPPVTETRDELVARAQQAQEALAGQAKMEAGRAEPARKGKRSETESRSSRWSDTDALPVRSRGKKDALLLGDFPVAKPARADTADRPSCGYCKRRGHTEDVCYSKPDAEGMVGPRWNRKPGKGLAQ